MYRSPLLKLLNDPYGYAPRAPVLAVAAIAAAVVSAAAAVKSGQDQKKIANYNADVLAEQGRATKMYAAVEEGKARTKADELMGRQRAAAAVSGVDVGGSPLLQLADTASQSEQDALSIRNSGDMNALKLNSQAALDRVQGKMAEQASYFTATSSLLKGASNYGAITSGAGAGTQIT